MTILEGIEILQTADVEASPVARRAIDLAGQMARQLGATVLVDDGFAARSDFYGRGKVAFAEQGLVGEAATWAEDHPERFLLIATVSAEAPVPKSTAAVVLHTDRHASEATLFAQSALADLLGDPTRPPIVPAGDFGAGTAAYAVLAALAALVCKRKRHGQTDIARVDGVGVLGWVNWKAAVAGEAGSDLVREGERAEWPVIPCADGFVALVFQERDWQPLIEMIGDPRLHDTRFESLAGRQRNRDEYMSYIRAWAGTRTKGELKALFLRHQIPATPVLTAADLLEDELLAHRQTFVPVDRDGGTSALTPRLAHRIVARSNAEGLPAERLAQPALPLAGLRVLDLGIITAGAGVSALLADLGAEVLKIESPAYPDPLRRWAGADASPLFNCNNRNKRGLAIDLKTASGQAQFLDLVETADVVVENFRRGVLDRLGLSYEALCAANPNVLLASISGQGLDGPGSEGTSFGSTLEASSGFAASVCYADGVPYITGRNVNYPDQMVVLYAAAAITAVLAGSQPGMHIDVSQRDVAVYLLGETVERLTAGIPASPIGNGTAYRSADQRWVAIDDAERLPALDGRPLSEWVGERSAADVVTRFAAAGIGAAIVRRGSEMYQALAASQSAAFGRSPNGALVKGFPFQLEGSPMTIHRDAPELSERIA